MEIISKQNETVSKIWGKGKIKDSEYRLINYILQTDVDEGKLLCNTVTGELVLLNESEQELIKNLPAPYSEEMKELVEKHFLVPTDYDEHQTVLSLRKTWNLFFVPKAITGYTILPTTACNARCFYCYEANYEHTNMTEETANAVVEYIKKNHGEHKISIGWFGGEPTLGEKRIDQICNGLIDAGIKYSASMISNGYLFSEEMVKKAKDLWKLNNIQITLDGTEETYNKVKSYVNVEGSPYQRVIRNIGLLLENEIFVSVRMNLDRHNYDDLHNLITFLSEKFGDNKFFSAYVHSLFDDCGFETVVHGDADRHWLAAKQLELNNLIKSVDSINDKRKALPALKPTMCMADSGSSVLIGPKGNIGKCEHCCEDNIGNIFDGVLDKEKLFEWKETVEYNTCPGCEIFPACVQLKKCFSCTGCLEDTRKDEIARYLNAIKKTYNGFINK